MRPISPARKALYYGGLLLIVAGFGTFGSSFVSAFSGVTKPEDPVSKLNRLLGEETAEDFFPWKRAIGGFGMIFAGIVLAGIGRAGLAGSGLVLDPAKARKDLEPWSRMAGGIANDALQEVDLAKKIGEGLGNPKPQVKVRCRKCQALNDEADKFCGQCGEKL